MRMRALALAAGLVALLILVWPLSIGVAPAKSAAADLATHATTPSPHSSGPRVSQDADGTRSTAERVQAVVAPTSQLHDGRRIAGRVLTESGDVLSRGSLKVQDKPVLPGGEDRQTVVTDVGIEGRFDLRLPKSWDGPTVHIDVVVDEKVLGTVTCTVSEDITIVVPDPRAGSGFWVTVHWTDYKPVRAGMLLQSRKRDSGFGESVWDTASERTFLQLVDRSDKITGELLILIGELHPSGRIQMMAMAAFPTLEALRESAETGISVTCAMTEVDVPPLGGRNALNVSVWSTIEAAPAGAPKPLEGGKVALPLSPSLAYRATGDFGDNVVALGVVRRDGRSPWIEWAGYPEADVGVRIRTVDTSGRPIAGAIATLVSRHEDRVLDGLHCVYGLSDSEGWIGISHLFRGPYDATCETMELGDMRRMKVRLEAPGPDVVCVIPDLHAVRLVGSGKSDALIPESLAS